MNLSFNQWVFMKVCPKMVCKPMANGTCVLCPFDAVANGCRTNWQYALVNKESRMYKMVFSNDDEVIDSLFKAKEIWYGDKIYENILFGRENELRITYDLEKSRL